MMLLGFYPSLAQSGYKKTGYASYYHDKFNGRKTASGETFSQKKMTCAHRTLPFGTRLKVTNLSNDSSVTVIVNDRGPYKSKRIIDVTKAAAKKLDFMRMGEARVRVEDIGFSEYADTLPAEANAEPEDTMARYSIHIAEYATEKQAVEMVRQLQQQTDRDIFIQRINEKSEILYQVFAGTFIKKKDANELEKLLKPFYEHCKVVKLSSIKE